MSLANSRFINRLNTNYIPSDSEILEIRALLVDPIEEITRMDAQIAEMELAIALISPMRLIPQDILQEIFISCLPTKHNAVIDHNEPPLLLGRICRYWRSVAYQSTPMLCYSIHLPALDHDYAPPNVLLRLQKIVAAWLERSASCPLSVSFGDSLNRVTPKPEKHPIILLLAAVAGRLRSLVLAGDAELAKPLLRLGPEDVPLLKTIRLKNPPSQSPSLDILQIPSLEDLTLCICTLDEPLSLPLPWSQLTTLRFECYGHRHSREKGVNFDGALDVLRNICELLRFFPLISHLQLSSKMLPPVWLNDEFMGLFGPPHNFCPVLTDVSILSSAAGFSDATILAFIKARMAMPTPLRRFEAHFNRPIEFDMMPEIQPFISEGLQVTFTFPPLPYAFRPRDGLDGMRSFFLIQ
ncbi:hypothetical protein C8R45DRAFT_1208067 [Mycena sanguinolenta]|nr:hypothetical protein C8R45DRAFT_1208067 [Mycena sanguinolenta]